MPIDFAHVLDQVLYLDHVESVHFRRGSDNRIYTEVMLEGEPSLALQSTTVKNAIDHIHHALQQRAKREKMQGEQRMAKLDAMLSSQSNSEEQK